MKQLNKITNQQFEKELNDKNNISIVKSAMSKTIRYIKAKYPSYVTPKTQDFDNIQEIAIWKTLIYYDGRFGTKFTTYLYKLTQQLCWAEFQKNKILDDCYIKTQLKSNKKLFYVKDYEEIAKSDLINTIFSKLNTEESKLLKMRFFEKRNLKKIGQEFGYSYETARKNIKKLIRRLKTEFCGVLL